MIQKSFILLSVCLAIIIFGNTRLAFSLPESTYGAYVKYVKATVSVPNPVSESAFFVFNAKEFNSVIFVGDVLLSRNVEYLMRERGSSYPYKGFNFSKISDRPAVIGNFEASIPVEHFPTPLNTVTFSVDEQHIDAAQQNGFTHFSLANNHSFDFDLGGFQNTKAVLKQARIKSFGQPEAPSKNSVSYIKLRDKTLAVIGVETLTGSMTNKLAAEVIQDAEMKSDFQIIYVHWGSEYAPTSNQSQREWAQLFVDAGADLIVGLHPHVVQEVGLIDGVLVFYSLGNYIFDQYFSTEVKEGLVIALNFDEASVDLIPVESATHLSQPRQMDSLSYGKFLRNLAGKSSNEIRLEITTGQLRLYNKVATSTKIAMINSIN